MLDSQIPQPPASLLKPERFARTALLLVKKKMQEYVGMPFKEMRDEFRKEYGLNEEEAREMILYTIRLSRVACNEIFDELEQRYKRRQDE